MALTYVMEPGALGEQKSKAAQLGIKRLMEVGDYAAHHRVPGVESGEGEGSGEDFDVHQRADAARGVDARCGEHLSRFPKALRTAGIDREVLTLLKLHDRVDQGKEDQARLKWRWFVDRIGKTRKEVTIAVTGKYTSLRDAYAIDHQSRASIAACTGGNVNFKWLDTTGIDASNVAKRLADCHGIIVPGGFGVRGTEGKIECIRYARENKVPYLGLCLGFQMAVIEYRAECLRDSRGRTARSLTRMYRMR